MAYELDENTMQIKLSSGDTMEFSMTLDADSFAMAIFSIFEPTTGRDLLRKEVVIDDQVVYVRLTNADTKYIEPGIYKWQIRLLSGYTVAPSGQIIVRDSDLVYSVFQPSAAPDFFISKDGAYV